MSRSRADLIARVLSRLGKAEAGQPVSAEDTAAVDPHLDGFKLELQQRNVCYLATLDDIPDEWFDSLSAIVADRLADDFGLPIDEAAKLQGRAEAAVKNLRLMTRGTVVSGSVQQDYF
jgi:hypothetical protein